MKYLVLTLCFFALDTTALFSMSSTTNVTTPFAVLPNNRALMHAIDEANIPQVKEAIKNGANVNVRLLDNHFNHRSPLVEAVYRLKCIKEETMLFDTSTTDQIVAATIDDNNNTYDDDAVKKSHEIRAYSVYGQIINILLSSGSSIEHTDEHNQTALHLAAYGLLVDIVKLLLDLDAPINIKDTLGETPFDRVIASWCWSDKAEDERARIVQLFKDHIQQKKNAKLEALVHILKTKQRNQPENNYIQHIPKDALRIIARYVCQEPS